MFIEQCLSKIQKTAFAACCCLWLSPAFAATSVYYWFDDLGVAHFSTQRPVGKLVYSVNMPTAPQSEGQNSSPQATEVVEPEQPLVEVAPETPTPMKDQARCEKAEKDIFTLVNKPVVRLKQLDGEYRAIDAEERAALLTQTKRTAKLYCEILPAAIAG